jgi:soluble lytic murein transglycosylase
MTALKENPDYNIALGSTYLQRLIDRYDGSYPLALAAYNGGMGNVDKWLAKYGDPRKGEIDMIDWIELIPFSETQNYVQRVMESTYIYRLKMRGIQESVSTPLHVSYR